MASPVIEPFSSGKTMQHIKQLTIVLIVLAVAGVLSACSTHISRGIADDGSSAEQLVWPAPEDVSALHRGGTWPTWAVVRHIQPGMNKKQIAALIGPPHYYEGSWDVREWNYVFHMRNPKTGEVRVCQFKVLFDDNEVAGSLYWKPEDCDAVPEPVKAIQQVITLHALFAFDKSGLDDIRAEARAQLRAVVDDLREWADMGSVIMVNGYADPIGSAAYNLELSRKRADTVRDYLVSRGVPASSVQSAGYGESLSIVNCDAAQTRAQRVDCLQPERRVEIVVKRGGDAATG